MVKLALGMNKLHKNEIIYSNLRPETILVDTNNNPFICDFGLPRNFDLNFIKNENLIFIPPEVHEGKEIELKSDVYSYSMIFYWLLTNKMPIFEGTTFTILSNILKGKRPDLTFIKEKSIKYLLQRCWAKKTKDRPSFDEIIKTITCKEFYLFFDVNSDEVSNYICSRTFKCMTLGKCMVGKSDLFITYQRQKTYEDSNPSQYLSHQLDIGQIRLLIEDNPGQEAFYKITKAYIQFAQVFFIFIDNNEDDLEKNISQYIKDISDMCPNKYVLYLIASKVDKVYRIPKEKLQDFANKNNMVLFMTSIYDLESVNSMFSAIADDLMEKFYILI